MYLFLYLYSLTFILNIQYIFYKHFISKNLQLAHVVGFILQY